MQAAAVYNPNHRARRRPEANPVGLGAAAGMFVGVLGVAGLTYGAVKLINRRSVLIPAIVTPSATAKRFFQVAVSQTGQISLTGPTAPGVTTSGTSAQIVSPEPVDAIISLPAGIGAQAEVGGDVELVNSSAQDFVFRWMPSGSGEPGEAALLLVGPPLNGAPVPLGEVVIGFRAA